MLSGRVAEHQSTTVAEPRVEQRKRDFGYLKASVPASLFTLHKPVSGLLYAGTKRDIPEFFNKTVEYGRSTLPPGDSQSRNAFSSSSIL
jgi:hypothetical protein